MIPRPRIPIGQQLMVVVPTVLMSALLAQLGVPVAPRVVASLGFGAVLIAALAYIRRRNQP